MMITVVAVLFGLVLMFSAYSSVRVGQPSSRPFMRWLLGLMLGAFAYGLLHSAVVARGPAAFFLQTLVFGLFCLWTCRFGGGGVIGWFLRMAKKFVLPAPRVRVLGCGQHESRPDTSISLQAVSPERERVLDFNPPAADSSEV